MNTEPKKDTFTTSEDFQNKKSIPPLEELIESNLNTLRKRISNIESGKTILVEHDLIEE